MSVALTPEQIAEIRDYWTLPPKERDERFGTWPLRHAADDIRALCDHLGELVVEQIGLRQELEALEP